MPAGGGGRGTAPIQAVTISARFPAAHQASWAPSVALIAHRRGLENRLERKKQLQRGRPWRRTCFSACPAARHRRQSCAPRPASPQDSAVAFLLQLDTGAKVQAHLYLCYDEAQPYDCPDGTASSGGARDGLAAAMPGTHAQHCCWWVLPRLAASWAYLAAAQSTTEPAA